eukprot:TRINITY_DN15047_c0_g1_i1.p1 TRINITY_DN15047_c0_g1~~TRINITY_DN15047_c0_g1_i1.p1  ORF type:complete len:230 (+),score=53.25 TRINITY_DN15047_c0_g1_i1:161-850(+)
MGCGSSIEEPARQRPMEGVTSISEVHSETVSEAPSSSQPIQSETISEAPSQSAETEEQPESPMSPRPQAGDPPADESLEAVIRPYVPPPKPEEQGDELTVPPAESSAQSAVPRVDSPVLMSISSPREQQTSAPAGGATASVGFQLDYPSAPLSARQSSPAVHVVLTADNVSPSSPKPVMPTLPRFTSSFDEQESAVPPSVHRTMSGRVLPPLRDARLTALPTLTPTLIV